MNLLMAGMLPTVAALRAYIASADNPLAPAFWFVMSMGLLVGFIIAYPMNWWLVANHLKHGMMTIRPPGVAGNAMAGMDMPSAKPAMSMGVGDPTRPPVPVMAFLSFLALFAGVAVSFLLRHS